jgi:hypothetical protein
MVAPEVRRDDIWFASSVGLVTGVFANLSVFWFPTLALVLGITTVAAGLSISHGSSGRRRLIASVVVALGLLAILATVAVVVFTTGSSSGTSADVVGPPA